MEVHKAYSIGFTKRNAREFFETLKKVGIKRLIDVRLNNSSQLAGFTKRTDLEYFLNVICQANYHCNPLLAPTQEILDAYKKNHGSWIEYELSFNHLMKERQIETKLSNTVFDIPTVLLCSENTPEYCHRRLVLEYLHDKWHNIDIVHL